MASMGKYQCANPNCRVMFEARMADRARGWARTCSKSCASVVRIMESPKQRMFDPKGSKPKWLRDDEMHEAALEGSDLK